jgi:hypothetical protein
VKWAALVTVEVPCEVLTVTDTLPCPDGLLTTSLFVPLLRTVADFEPKKTLPPLRCLPLIVTCVPPADLPEAGCTLVTTGFFDASAVSGAATAGSASASANATPAVSDRPADINRRMSVRRSNCPFR